MSKFKLSEFQSSGRHQWYKGRYPHCEAGEVPQSITIRLFGSTPEPIIKASILNLHRLKNRHEKLKAVRKIEAMLLQNEATRWLTEPKVAQVVEKALLHFDGTRYQLHAWVIMPNHIHALITPLGEYRLSLILQSWKGFSARSANTILGRSGSFWEIDYFDRLIRDEDHFYRSIEYIHQNPVRAGLSKSAASWRWSSAWSG